jgi:hypothetical protein
MLVKDLMLRNPFRLLGEEAGQHLESGQLGAVLARAGVGKTAFLVQLALNGLLRDQRVLHISINDPVNKVTLWNEEVFRHITDQYQDQAASAQETWEAIAPHRFIMTFKVEGFTVPKLQERLTDLTAQNIFSPDIVIIDGLPVDGQDVEILKELKALSASGGYPVWVTVLTHRHDETDASGLPVKLADAVECFDAVIQLQPEKDKIHVRAIKGTAEIKSDGVLLDPESHLITAE